MRDTTIVKWRTINLSNALLKPVVAKNPEGTHTFLKKVGFTKDEKTNSFKFQKAESTDKSTVVGNTRTLKLVLEAMAAAQEGKLQIEEKADPPAQESKVEVQPIVEVQPVVEV